MNQLSCHVQTSNGIKRPTMSELVMEQACGLLSESFQTQALVTKVRAAQFAAASETLEISLMPSPGGQEKDRHHGILRVCVFPVLPFQFKTDLLQGTRTRKAACNGST